MVGTERLLEQALGIAAPWAVRQVRVDAAARRLTIAVDFAAGSRFAHPAHPGQPPGARHPDQAAAAPELLPERLPPRGAEAAGAAVDAT